MILRVAGNMYTEFASPIECPKNIDNSWFISDFEIKASDLIVHT